MKKREIMTLPELPYAYDALEPIISSETLRYHHDKHHRAYVEQLNKLLSGTELESASLENLVMESTGALFEQASQHWSHSFYWKSMNPELKMFSAKGPFSHEMKAAFGSVSNFYTDFKKAGEGLFGSGWVWLVTDSMDNLQIMVTKNAWNPIKEEFTPLLACDLWEHAYYIDHRNARSKYLSRFCDIIDWDFVETNYANHKQAHAHWAPLKQAGGLRY